MIPEQVEQFKNSSRVFSSQDLTETYLAAKKRLMNQWEATPLDQAKEREQIYMKLKAMDEIFIQLIFDWSKS